MKRLRNLTLFFFITLFLVLSGVCVMFVLQNVHDLMHPTRFPCCEKPENMAFTLEDVALETSDSLTLWSWYVPPKNGAVILARKGE